jgi:hypothetical protein
MKNNYYIPIFFQTNSYSGEKLVGGILFFSSDHILIKIAESKIKATTQIGSIDGTMMIRQTMQMLVEKLQNNKQLFTNQYLEYLHHYSNGVVQFGEPKPIHLSLQAFDDFASKFIGEKSNLQNIVNQKLNNIEKLLEKTDVPYIFHFSSWRKPYKVHLKLSKNSQANFILQSITFQNTSKTIHRHLNLYEKAMKEIEKCANGKNSFALVIQKPIDSEAKEILLNNFKTKNPQCEIIDLRELDEKLRQVIAHF